MLDPLIKCCFISIISAFWISLDFNADFLLVLSKVSMLMDFSFGRKSAGNGWVSQGAEIHTPRWVPVYDK